MQLIAGVDEAGRGPLVGSVFAAAVILPQSYDLPGLTDSKKLSENKRDELALLIKEQAVAFAIAEANIEEIAQFNILHATMLAMKRAIHALTPEPQLALIDGNRIPTELKVTARAIVKGDLTEPAISAASILAKTVRDAQMHILHQQYPEYGFDKHKGYGTAAHLAALQQYGLLTEHRKDFAPVRKLLSEGARVR